MINRMAASSINLQMDLNLPNSLIFIMYHKTQVAGINCVFNADK